MNTFALTHPRAARLRPSSGALLGVVCLAQFMVILDVSIVNVALPSIRDSLHFSVTGLQWVVNAYTLTFAGFLMLGGRASDLLGRRRVFLAGTALFALASLACALSDSRGLLIGARAIQGIGGAVISPASLAIITTSFAEGRERNRALGVWGAVGGIGAASGALLGGLLTQGLGWQWVFLVNVPVGIAVLAIAPALVPAARAELGHRHFDVAGALLVTSGFIALVFGIVRSDTLGWGAPGVLLPDRRGRRDARGVRRRRGALRHRAARAAVDLQARAAARRQPRRARALQRRLRDVVLHLALRAAGAGLGRDQDRPGLPADDDRRRDRLLARTAAGCPLRHARDDHRRHVARRPRPADPHRHASGRGLPRDRPPGRHGRRGRPGPRAGPVDDRRGPGGPRRRGGRRLRAAQHLAPARWRARPRRAEHDRRRADARRAARRRARARGAHRRLRPGAPGRGADRRRGSALPRRRCCARGRLRSSAPKRASARSAQRRRKARPVAAGRAPGVREAAGTIAARDGTAVACDGIEESA